MKRLLIIIMALLLIIFLNKLALGQPREFEDNPQVKEILKEMGELETEKELLEEYGNKWASDETPKEFEKRKERCNKRIEEIKAKLKKLREELKKLREKYEEYLGWYKKRYPQPSASPPPLGLSPAPGPAPMPGPGVIPPPPAPPAITPQPKPAMPTPTRPEEPRVYPEGPGTSPWISPEKGELPADVSRPEGK